MKNSKDRTRKSSFPDETKLFIRIQIASIFGSAADYLTTIILASRLNIYYLVANLTGNILGGTVQFWLCRKWAFHADEGKLNGQIFRFALIFSMGLGLSAGGVFLLTNFAHLHYVLSKTIISIVLGVTYNYWFQKKFVFASGQ